MKRKIKQTVQTKRALSILMFVLSCIFSNAAFAQNELWGMTSEGGQYGTGTIFKTDASGNNQTVQHSFVKSPGGSIPVSGLIQTADGNFYGLTEEGGANDMGVLFQYNPVTNAYVNKFDFGYTNGRWPLGTLMQASDGNLYGMTNGGGKYDDGVLFQYNPITDSYSKKHDFDGNNGSYPLGSLIQATDGNLYGVTLDGGASGMGVLFQYNPNTNTYTVKLSFNGTNGRFPYESLMQAADGNLYGITSEGGTSNGGVLFQYNLTTNTLTKKLDFNGANGSTPRGSLMQATDGNLYGMTYYGGTNNLGVLYQYNPNTDTYTKKLDFIGNNGSQPNGSLIQASDGNLYGMTQTGGVNNKGVLFQYNPASNSYTKNLDFDGQNGRYPISSLMQAVDGNLYGMTIFGGVYDWGVLFQYNLTNNTYLKKLDFEYGTDGLFPYGTLLKAADGNLYGMTSKGGLNNIGVLFQFNPTTYSFTKKLDFDGNNGRNPYGSLIQAADGSLYGITPGGGANNMGVLFQYHPATNTYNKKHDFDVANGVGPRSLIQAADGNFYGITYGGGRGNRGVLFQYNPATNTYTKKLDFGPDKGSNPTGLMQASDGNLYGTTYRGGANSVGVLFKYNPLNNNYVKKIDFEEATTGRNPHGTLVQAIDGNLYGTTNSGLFKYNSKSNTITKIPFSGGVYANYSEGSLLQAADGNLYGMTLYGGASNKGVLFQYNPTTNIFSKKLDFSGINCSHPRGSLIQTYDCPVLIGGLTAKNITASSATTKWDSDDCAVGYKFQYRIPGVTNWTTLHHNLDYPIKKLRGLLPATTYEWRVQSKFADGTYGVNSVAASFTTLALRSGFEMIDNTSDLVVYPNPAADQLTLEFPFTEGVSTKITVVNTIGQTVLEQNVSDDLSTIQLNIQSLTKGLYVVTVTNGDNTFTARFIKE